MVSNGIIFAMEFFTNITIQIKWAGRTELRRVRSRRSNPRRARRRRASQGQVEDGQTQDRLYKQRAI